MTTSLAEALQKFDDLAFRSPQSNCFLPIVRRSKLLIITCGGLSCSGAWLSVTQH